MASSNSSASKDRQIQYNENRKRKREASKEQRHLLEIRVSSGDEERLARIKERLQSAKDLNNIDGKNSKTQNADIIESLLAFETHYNTSAKRPKSAKTTVTCFTQSHKTDVHTS